MNPASEHVLLLDAGDIRPRVDSPGLRVVHGRRQVALPAHGRHDGGNGRTEEGEEAAAVTSFLRSDYLEDSNYRASHVLVDWVLLTWIWDVPPPCFGSR